MAQSILIIRMSAIGDVIHALPCLEALRAVYPAARIGWLVEELSAPLIEGHPALDRLYVIPKKRWRENMLRMWRSEVVPFFRRIREEGWDAAVDLQGLTKSGLAAWASGARLRIGYGDRDGREINKWFTNRKVVPPATARHVVERNLSLLKPLGVESPALAACGRVAVGEEELSRVRGFFAEWGVEGRRDVVALNPGAGWSTKRWPPIRFAEVGEQLYREAGLKSLVLWGPREEGLRDAVMQSLRARGVDAREAPPTSLRELAAFGREVALFVGGDTGPTHMAALQGTPTVGVFGGSDGMRNGPWGPRAAVVQTGGLPCVPCWKQECRLRRPDPRVIPCLEAVSGREVAAAGLRLLGSGAPRPAGVERV